MILVSEPILGLDEKAALLDVIESGWITMGDRVGALEHAFAEKHEVSEAVAVSSCTAALHLILHALGIGPGDEVLVPSMTFVATANCVLYTGAVPVFVDITSLDRPLISLADAAAKCTAKTKAVIVMHYAGYVVNRDAWQCFARERGLYLIEDAAHAVGAGQAGSFGDAAAFSFYGNKNMTTAEGGMVTARDSALISKIRQMRGHGMTSGTFQRNAGRAVGYDVTMLGFNYRMDELRAAIGLVQLGKLMHWNAKRKTLTLHYMRLLGERCPEILVPFATGLASKAQSSSQHIMPIILPEGVDRNKVIVELRNAGIQTSNHYPAVHRLSFYRQLFPSLRLARTEEFSRRQLTLPLHPRLEDSQVDFIVSTLKKVLRQDAHTLGGSEEGLVA